MTDCFFEDLSRSITAHALRAILGESGEKSRGALFLSVPVPSFWLTKLPEGGW